MIQPVDSLDEPTRAVGFFRFVPLVSFQTMIDFSISTSTTLLQTNTKKKTTTISRSKFNPKLSHYIDDEPADVADYVVVDDVAKLNNNCGFTNYKLALVSPIVDRSPNLADSFRRKVACVTGFS